MSKNQNQWFKFNKRINTKEYDQEEVFLFFEQKLKIEVGKTLENRPSLFFVERQNCTENTIYYSLSELLKFNDDTKKSGIYFAAIDTSKNHLKPLGFIPNDQLAIKGKPKYDEGTKTMRCVLLIRDLTLKKTVTKMIQDKHIPLVSKLEEIFDSLEKNFVFKNQKEEEKQSDIRNNQKLTYAKKSLAKRLLIYKKFFEHFIVHKTFNYEQLSKENMLELCENSGGTEFCCDNCFSIPLFLCLLKKIGIDNDFTDFSYFYKFEAEMIKLMLKKQPGISIQKCLFYLDSNYSIRSTTATCKEKFFEFLSNGDVSNHYIPKRHEEIFKMEIAKFISISNDLTNKMDSIGIVFNGHIWMTKEKLVEEVLPAIYIRLFEEKVSKLNASEIYIICDFHSAVNDFKNKYFSKIINITTKKVVKHDSPSLKIEYEREEKFSIQQAIDEFIFPPCILKNMKLIQETGDIKHPNRKFLWRPLLDFGYSEDEVIEFMNNQQINSDQLYQLENWLRKRRLAENGFVNDQFDKASENVFISRACSKMIDEPVTSVSGEQCYGCMAKDPKTIQLYKQRFPEELKDMDEYSEEFKSLHNIDICSRLMSAASGKKNIVSFNSPVTYFIQASNHAHKNRKKP